MDEKLPQTSRQAFRFASLLLDARQQALHRTFPCHAALRFSHVLSIHLDLDLLCSFQGPRASPDAVRASCAGGDNEVRTRDLLRARQALSQLSYIPG